MTSWLFSYVTRRGKFELHYITAGILGGLVSITCQSHLIFREILPQFDREDLISAQCPIVAPLEAFFIGAVGGGLCIGAHEVITKLFKIDDPVGCVSVHGVGGIWGVISFAIFAHSDVTEVGLISEAGINVTKYPNYFNSKLFPF